MLRTFERGQREGKGKEDKRKENNKDIYLFKYIH